MNEMVERVAQALLGANVGTPSVWDLVGYKSRQMFREHARAAIAAMREPTAAMVGAGWPLTGDPCWEKDLAEAWTRMVDTALAD